MAASNPMTVNGRACYIGVTGVLVSGSVILTGTTVLQTLALKRTTPVARLKDGATNTLAKGYARPVDTLTIKFCPVAVSGTNTWANAAANVKLPVIGGVVTISDTGLTDIDGDWNYDGEGSIDPDNSGPLTITLTLSREGTNAGAPAALVAAT